MQSRTSMVLSTLHAVQDFMTTHASELGNLNTSGSRQDLDDIEAALSDYARAQAKSKNGGSAAGTRTRVAKNTLLVKYLRPIAAIAQAKLSQSPDYAEFKLPKSTRSVPALVAAAEAMGETAAKYADTFTVAGMAPTFIADLQTATNDVVAAENSKGANKASRLGASSALQLNTQQAHRIVKQLDALIEPQLASDPALLVQWKATKRFSGKAPSVSSAAADSAQVAASAITQQVNGGSTTPSASTGGSSPATTSEATPPATPAAPVQSTPPASGAPTSGGATTA